MRDGLETDLESLWSSTAENFVDLAKVANLDPQTDFQNANLRNLNFSNCDLTGFNFSASDLDGACFDDAMIKGAYFSNATVDWRALAKARDWPDVNQRALIQTTAGHLSLASRFGDVRIDENAWGDELEAFHDAWAGSFGARSNRAQEERDLESKSFRKVRSLWLSDSEEDQDTAIRILFYVTQLRNNYSDSFVRFMSILYVIVTIMRFYRANDRLLKLNRVASLTSKALAKFCPSDFDDIGIYQGIKAAFAEYEVPNLSSSIIPGIRLIGQVEEVDPAEGITVLASGARLFVPVSLLSVDWFHKVQSGTLDVGASGFFTTITKSWATQRGSQFVAGIIDSFFPFLSDRASPTFVYSGSSNSWSLLAASAQKKSALIGQGGRFSDFIKQSCGLRRITITSRSGNAEADTRNFINDTWRTLQIVEHAEHRVVVRAATQNEYEDLRKVRSFVSMWKKVFPGIDLVFPDLDSPQATSAFVDDNTEDEASFPSLPGAFFAQRGAI
jgi:hypothetical protein